MNERIKRLRKTLDLTQQDFAARIGTTQNALTGYETGRRNPSSSVVNNICKTFNVSEAWLRTGEGEMFVQLPKDEALEQQLREFLKGGSDTFRERLISLLLRLPPEHWEALEQYAQELVDSRSDPPAVQAIAPLPPPEPEPAQPQGLAAELAELKRQNQMLADKVAALEEEAADAANVRDSVKAAEVAYEKSLGIVPKPDAPVWNISDDMEAGGGVGTA